MSFQQDRNSDFIELTLTSKDELKNTSKLSFGECPDCKKEWSNVRWCKYCEINAFKEDFENWTSGNLKIDNFIKHTQLNATGSTDYLEYIDFEQLDLIKNIHKSGIFSTIYSAIWMKGPRWIWDEDAEQWIRNGPIKVALKRLNNSQNINEEYLNQVSHNFKYIIILHKNPLLTFV